MEELSSYEKKKKSILKYQKNRLENDEAFRKKYYDKRNEELKEKYKNDDEYKKLVIERNKIYLQNKDIEEVRERNREYQKRFQLKKKLEKEQQQLISV